MVGIGIIRWPVWPQPAPVTGRPPAPSGGLAEIGSGTVVDLSGRNPLRSPDGARDLRKGGKLPLHLFPAEDKRADGGIWSTRAWRACRSTNSPDYQTDA